MNREDVIRIAKEVWGDDSGKPWHESALVHLEAFAMRVEAEGREKVAAWMIQHSYATGPGETTEDLLAELDWQIAENWNRAMINGVETEREACAKVCEVLSKDRGMIDDEILKKGVLAGASMCALVIRKRGAP